MPRPIGGGGDGNCGGEMDGGSGCGDDNNGGGDINGGDGSSHQQFHNTSWVKVLCRVHTVPLS